MEFYIVDAFCNQPFGGNPAGVLIYKDTLDPRVMQKIATEVRFSETAFVRQFDDNIFDVRFFTPNSEVDLCGHATISAFEVLRSKNAVKSGSNYTMRTKQDSLTIYISDGFIMMEQSTPQIKNTNIDVKELCEILGITIEDIGDIHYNITPKIVTTGLWDIIFPVKSKEILNKINPNFDKLSNVSEKYGVVGLHAFTLDCEANTAACRNFAPLFDINEEAATGTSNGALSYYLFVNDILKENTPNSFIQGEKMGRPSIITSEVINNAGTIKVQVGGNSKIILKGEFFL